MSSGGDGGLPILSWDTEMVSPLAMLLNTATMEFFSSTFFSLIPERLDAARAFGSLAFFMRTKARRDRVMYPRRSTRFVRVYLYLYKVFAFYFGHTLETLFSQTQHLNICMGHSGTKSNSSGLPMRTLHCSLNSSGAKFCMLRRWKDVRYVTAMAFLRRCRCFALTPACDRYFFSGDARASRTCAKRIFRIRGDGKVYRGVYLRLYKSCTKMFILASSTGWEAHRRRTAVFISRENAVFGPKKID